MKSYIPIAITGQCVTAKQAFVMRFRTEDGQSIEVELRGRNVRDLLDAMNNAFSRHPQMKHWESASESGGKRFFNFLDDEIPNVRKVANG